MKLLKILQKLDKGSAHCTSITIFADGSDRIEQGDSRLGQFDNLYELNDLSYRLFYDRRVDFEVTL